MSTLPGLLRQYLSAIPGTLTLVHISTYQYLTENTHYCTIHVCSSQSYTLLSTYVFSYTSWSYTLFFQEHSQSCTLLSCTCLLFLKLHSVEHTLLSNTYLLFPEHTLVKLYNSWSYTLLGIHISAIYFVKLLGLFLELYSTYQYFQEHTLCSDMHVSTSCLSSSPAFQK